MKGKKKYSDEDIAKAANCIVKVYLDECEHKSIEEALVFGAALKVLVAAAGRNPDDIEIGVLVKGKMGI